MLAIAAGGAAYLYLRNVQNRAYHNAALASVYVVEGAIPRGTPASAALGANLIKKAQIPQQFRPVDAVTDLAALQGDVAVADLVPGEVVSASLFVSPAVSVSSTSAAIPKGDVAITVSVNSVQGVAGLIEPGDLVDMLVLDNRVERVLYQNARVLAVGTSVATQLSGTAQVAAATATTAPPASGNSGLITLAVHAAAAERLAFVESGGGGVVGSLYLALVPPTNRPSPQGSVGLGNLFPATLTPG